ncbi:MAG TPA: hypothetical protein GXX38_10305 [Clostridia bacterium]|nr:hypothetical protein [Clostridia bacterium]
MDKKEKNRQCRVCGLPITDPGLIRCPRCNTVLLKLVSCSGNCRECQIKNDCKER